MSPVQPWAQQVSETLSHFHGQPLRETDLSDDRLAEVLRVLSLDPVWQPFERVTSQQMLRVYRLPTERIRLDSTTVSVHTDPAAAVLFQRGHSKDHRPDLPQFKAMVAALDPLGALLAVDVVPGNRADDGLYVPLIDRLRTIVPAAGLLYIGDSKMSALATRAHLQATRNTYLMPLARVGQLASDLTDWITAAVKGRVALTTLRDTDRRTVLGQGYERSRLQAAETPTGQVQWTERVLLVHSNAFAGAARQAFQNRLTKAQAALQALTPPPGRGRRQFSERALLQAAVETLVQEHDVGGFLTLSLKPETHRRTIRAYRGQPARIETTIRFVVQVQPRAAAIAAYEQTLGWRVYATNASGRALSLTQAVQAYRDEFLVERHLSRLKGRPLSLAPLWLTRDDHAVGLTRLLTLGARLLALAEYTVRRKLHESQRSLVGLYPGQSSRATDQPTTERLLLAFKQVTLTLIRSGRKLQRVITPLSKLQVDLLNLLNSPTDLYTRLASQSRKPLRI